MIVSSWFKNSSYKFKSQIWKSKILTDNIQWSSLFQTNSGDPTTRVHLTCPEFHPDICCLTNSIYINIWHANKICLGILLSHATLIQSPFFYKLMFLSFKKYYSTFFYLGFFHRYWKFIGQQGRWGTIFIPLCHFHPLTNT